MPKMNKKTIFSLNIDNQNEKKLSVHICTIFALAVWKGLKQIVDFCIIAKLQNSICESLFHIV